MKLKKSELSPENQSKLVDILSAFDDKNVLQSSDYELQIESLETPKILYHYTSLSTFLKILKQVKDQQFILRGTNIKYLNDWSEFSYGTEVLKEFIRDYEEKNPGVEIRSDKVRDADWEQLICFGGHATPPFITSFSKNQDSLPMWSMYGDNGNGIAIGIERKTLKKLDYNKQEEDPNQHKNTPSLYQCRYNKNELSNSLKVIPHISKSLYDIFNKTKCIINIPYNINYIGLRNTLCTEKHPAFEYEKEWRLIKQCSTWDQNKEIFVNDTTHIPYIENTIPITGIKEIVVGPCENFETTKDEIKIALSLAGLELNESQIIQSTAPYRQNI